MIELVTIYAEYEKDEHERDLPKSGEAGKSFEIVATSSSKTRNRSLGG